MRSNSKYHLCRCNYFQLNKNVRYIWCTLISQAGVALGLALEVASRFPDWGREFQTLVLSIVVINQVIGPPLCKLGFSYLVRGEEDNQQQLVPRTPENGVAVSTVAASPYLRLRRWHTTGVARTAVSEDGGTPSSAYHLSVEGAPDPPPTIVPGGQ